MRIKTASPAQSNREPFGTPALGLIRKEKPVPVPKQPARPPNPEGIKAPGSGGSAPGSMVCDGPEGPQGGDWRCASRFSAGADGALDQTALESQAQRVLRKPSLLGGKSIFLTVIEGSEKGRSFDITGIGTYTIGRKDCDVVLDDEKSRVNAEHASI